MHEFVESRADATSARADLVAALSTWTKGAVVAVAWQGTHAEAGGQPGWHIFYLA